MDRSIRITKFMKNVLNDIVIVLKYQRTKNAKKSICVL